MTKKSKDYKAENKKLRTELNYAIIVVVICMVATMVGIVLSRITINNLTETSHEILGTLQNCSIDYGRLSFKYYMCVDTLKTMMSDKLNECELVENNSIGWEILK